MSVSFWMNQSTLAVDRTIVAQYDYPSDGSWAINSGGSTGTEDELRIWIADGTGAVVPYATTYAAELKANAWYHVAVVFDGTQTGNANRLRVYIDGISQTLAFVGASLSPPNSADVNHDGKINIFDINLVSSNWGGTSAGDANGDGTVNIFDINQISSQWDHPAFDLNSNGNQIPNALRQSNAPINVGKLGGTLERYYDGSLDSLAIYSIVLTPNQIAALYNAGEGPEYPDLSSQQKNGLLAWWDFDEPTNATRMDATGHGWNLADTTHVAQRQIVSQWRGTGLGPMLEQSSARRPDYVENAIHGNGAVYFDGSNDVLRAAVGNYPNDRAGSVFFVVRFPEGSALTASPTIFSSADESTYSNYFFFAAYVVDPVTHLDDFEGVPRFRIRWRNDDLNITEVASTNIEHDTTYIVNISTLGRTVPYVMRVNGVEQTLTATGAPTLPTITGSWFDKVPGRDNVTIGAFQRANSDIEAYAKALVGEVVTFNEFMTEAENRQVEQYLAEKWGVALPAGEAATVTESSVTESAANHVESGDSRLVGEGVGQSIPVPAVQVPISMVANSRGTEELAAAVGQFPVAGAMLARNESPLADPRGASGSLVGAAAILQPRTAAQSLPAIDRALADCDEPWTSGLHHRAWKFARSTESLSRPTTTSAPSTMPSISIVLQALTGNERLRGGDAI